MSFHGSCMIKLASRPDGKSSYKRIDQVVKGDVLHNGSIVLCVVKLNIVNRPVDMINIKKKNPLGHQLFIVPWNPVYDYHSMAWHFPHDLNDIYNPTVHDMPEFTVKKLQMFTEALYSFQLDSGHIIDIGDVPCVTLGHGFVDKVRAHPFFGTDKVIECIKKFPGYNNGIVEFSGTKRDARSSLVLDFKFSTSFFIPIVDEVKVPDTPVRKVTFAPVMETIIEEKSGANDDCEKVQGGREEKLVSQLLDRTVAGNVIYGQNNASAPTELTVRKEKKGSCVIQ